MCLLMYGITGIYMWFMSKKYPLLVKLFSFLIVKSIGFYKKIISRFEMHNVNIVFE